MYIETEDRPMHFLKPGRVILSLLATAGFAVAQVPSDEPPEDPDWRPKTERRILARLNDSAAPVLKCDFVLNPAAGAALSMRAIPGRTTILNFWRPNCEPCKPLLKELAAFSRRAPDGIVVLAAAEGAKQLGLVAVRQQIKTIVQESGVVFPVCGYTDHAQTKRWQAEGVPLTLFFDGSGRVGRVALGAVEGSAALEQLRGGWRP